MKVIIAGSRGVESYTVVRAAVQKVVNEWQEKITCVLSGRAYGVDRLGESWAVNNKIRLDFYPADWVKYGKSAGFIRNKQMAENADALIAVWDGKSRGTKNMIDVAKQKGLKVFVYEV